MTTRTGTLDDGAMEDASRKVMARLNPNFKNFTQPVKSLSGGQRQAVAIARAVHFNARILIMDEPTAALGPAETAQVRNLIKQLKEEGIGIFLISHDIHDVYDLSDRVGVMYHGRLVATVDKANTSTDDILGMIILGKAPGRRSPGRSLPSSIPETGSRGPRPSPAMNEMTIASADVSLTVLPEIGGRIHRLRAFGHDVLRTPADPEQHLREPFFWGGYNMAPWCNRISATPTEVAGANRRPRAPNFRDGSAIHGQVYERAWETVGEGEFRVEGGGDGWPWRYEALLTVEVDERRVLMTQTVRNLDDGQMPAGIGLHPWFVGSPLVAIRAGQVYATNTDCPAEPTTVDGASDLRAVGLIDGVDATWAVLMSLPWNWTGRS